MPKRDPVMDLLVSPNKGVPATTGPRDTLMDATLGVSPVQGGGYGDLDSMIASLQSQLTDAERYDAKERARIRGVVMPQLEDLMRKKNARDLLRTK